MAKKKKKQKKQKPVPRFLDVMNRGVGGKIVQKEVGFADALMEFGQPVMDFITEVQLKRGQPDMEMFQSAIKAVQLVWNKAADGYQDLSVDELNECGHAGFVFDWERLLPVMLERHKQMFPDFKAPEVLADPSFTINLEADEIELFNYLSQEIIDKFPDPDVDLDDLGEGEFDIEKQIEQIDRAVKENPENADGYLDYGRLLTAEERFEEALERFEVGYMLLQDSNNKELVKMFRSEILDCLHMLKRDYSDFPWRTVPELMGEVEFEQKAYSYLSELGGNAPLVNVLNHVLGSKHLDPGENAMAKLLSGDRIALVPGTVPPELQLL